MFSRSSTFLPLRGGGERSLESWEGLVSLPKVFRIVLLIRLIALRTKILIQDRTRIPPQRVVACSLKGEAAYGTVLAGSCHVCFLSTYFNRAVEASG